MSMCESILTIALVCTVKYLHYCDYYYTLGNDSQSTPKLIAYFFSAFVPCLRGLRQTDWNSPQRSWEESCTQVAMRKSHKKVSVV